MQINLLCFIFDLNNYKPNTNSCAAAILRTINLYFHGYRPFDSFSQGIETSADVLFQWLIKFHVNSNHLRFPYNQSVLACVLNYLSV